MESTLRNLETHGRRDMSGNFSPHSNRAPIRSGIRRPHYPLLTRSCRQHPQPRPGPLDDQSNRHRTKALRGNLDLPIRTGRRLGPVTGVRRGTARRRLPVSGIDGDRISERPHRWRNTLNAEIPRIGRSLPGRVESGPSRERRMGHMQHLH